MISPSTARPARRRPLIASSLATLLFLTGPALSADFTVAGHSMRPTLGPGDQIRVHEGFYARHPLTRDDLIAIRLKARPRPLVKRAVAIAGDRVVIRGGRLHVGERAWPLPRRGGRLLAIQLKRLGGVIPPEHLIALGDNPEVSHDSAALGLLHQRQLLGKVEILRRAAR